MRNCEADSETLWNSMSGTERSKALRELAIVPKIGSTIESLSLATFSELPEDVQATLRRANGGLGFSARAHSATVWVFAQLRSRFQRVVFE